MLVYSLRKATVDGRTGLYLTPLELLGPAAGPDVESLRDPAFGDGECLPLQCPRCGEPMRIIAFILEPAVIERILLHVGEPIAAPAVLPARAPPQAGMDFDQVAGTGEWPEMDQTVGEVGDTWA